MLTVKKIMAVNGTAITYEFSDGSVATHQTVKDNRGFLHAGPLETVNSAQLVAVSNYNIQAIKPDGGWL